MTNEPNEAIGTPEAAGDTGPDVQQDGDYQGDF